MDNSANESESKKLDTFLSAHKKRIKDKEGDERKTNSRTKVEFCGREVYKNEIQNNLDKMDHEDRFLVMIEDLSIKFSDRLNDLTENAIQSGEKKDKKDAKSLLMEWGSFVEAPDIIKGDSEDAPLAWVDRTYLKKLHQNKRSIEFLLDEDE